jgi:hypothetical protein
LMVQPEFARRKASASSSKIRMVPDTYSSQSALSQTSPSGVVHSGVVPAAHAASTRINERLLA